MWSESGRPDHPEAIVRDPKSDLETHNTVSGGASNVVQTGVVHGDVHLHTTSPTAPPAPRQLPASPAVFAGRTVELASLDRALSTLAPHLGRDGIAPSVGTTMMISAIGGAGGIGKTWLALHWAHRHIDLFPDGQLFVDLRGFSPDSHPLDSAVAVRGFLDALGVDPGRLPVDLDSQAALYRSLVADKRMLIVLDNAATADQVVPLLPGASACTVLVTSRNRLASLIDRHSARYLQLDVLSLEEARALMVERLGEARVTAESRAIDELIELCGHYPLALAITARQASGLLLTEVVSELRELGVEMLDHDTDPAASLPAVLSWSLNRLNDEQRVTFGLLGISPGPDTTLPSVSALTGLHSAHARKVVSTLEEASLLERRPNGRYAMHDLVRAYAAATARTLLDDVREAALKRVVDFYLHTAHMADRLLEPQRSLMQPDPPAPDVHLFPLPDSGAAMAWLEAEHVTLLAAQRTAVGLHQHRVVWHLAWVLDALQFRRGYLHDALTSWQAALDSAMHLPDPATRTGAYRSLGTACCLLGWHEKAIGYLDLALGLAVRHQDATEQAHTHRHFALAWELQGDNRRALRHAQQALNLHRSLNQPKREADALNQVGWLAALLGEFDIAHNHCLAALAMHRRHGYRAGEAATLDSLGFIAHHTGSHRESLDFYRQALNLRRILGHTYDVAYTLDRIGNPYAILGHHEQARTVWQEALELYRDQGRDADALRVQQQLKELDDTTSVGPD
jgi:tetratricopeptide (TPR) repeat protein